MGNAPKPGLAKLAKIQAEVSALGGVVVELRGEPIEIKPFGDWPMEAYEDLQDGKYRTWAEGCLTEDGLEMWRRLKPTVNEVPQFFADYDAVSGQDLGK